MSSDENVPTLSSENKVLKFCRFRPFIKFEMTEETDKKAQCSVAFHKSLKNVLLKFGVEKPVKFDFDKVFPMSTTPDLIYETFSETFIKEMISSNNIVIISCGGKLSGKTFMLTGSKSKWEISDISVNDGLIMRCYKSISDIAQQDNSISVTMNIKKIVRNEIVDLLGSKTNGTLSSMKDFNDLMQTALNSLVKDQIGIVLYSIKMKKQIENSIISNTVCFVDINIDEVPPLERIFKGKTENISEPLQKLLYDSLSGSDGTYKTIIIGNCSPHVSSATTAKKTMETIANFTFTETITNSLEESEQKSEMNTEIEKIKSSYEDMLSKMKQNDVIVKDKIQKLALECKNIREEKEELNNLITTLLPQKIESIRTIIENALKEREETIQTEHNQTVQNMEDLVAKLKVSVSEKESQIERIAEQLSEYVSQCSYLNQQITALSNSSTNNEGIEELIKMETMKKDEQIAELLKETKSYCVQINDLNERIKINEEQIAEENKLKLNIEKENEMLKNLVMEKQKTYNEQIDLLESKQSDMISKAEYTELSYQHQQLLLEMAQLKQEYRSIYDQFTEKSQHADELTNEINVLQTRIDSTIKTNEECQLSHVTERNYLLQRIEALEKKTVCSDNDLLNEKKKIEEENRNLKSSQELKEKEIEQQLKEIEDFKTKLSKTEEESNQNQNNYKIALEEKEQVIETLNNKIESMMKNTEELEKALKNKDEENAINLNNHQSLIEEKERAMREKEAKLEEEIMNIKQNTQCLEIKLENMAENNNILLKEKEELELTVSKLLAQSEELKIKNSLLECEFQRVTTNLEVYSSKNKELEITLQSITENQNLSNNELESKILDLRNQMLLLNNEKEKLELCLNDKLIKGNEENLNLQSKIEELNKNSLQIKDENETLKEEINGLKSNINSLSSTKKQTESEKEELLKFIGLLKEKISGLEQEKEIATEKINKLATEKKKSTESNRSLEERLENITKEYKKIKSLFEEDKSETKAKIEKLSKVSKEKDKENKDLKKEREELLHKIEELESEVKNQSQEVSQLKNDLERKSSQLLSVEKKLNENASDNSLAKEQLLATIDDLNSKLENQTRLLEEAGKKQEIVKDGIESNGKEKILSTIQTLIFSLEKAKQEKNHYKQQNKQLESEVREWKAFAKSKMDSYNSQYEQCESIIAEMKEKIRISKTIQ